MGLAARRVAKHFGVPCAVNVQDLFPQSVIDLGLLKDPLLVEFFAMMERRVYRGADLIMVMSDGNRDYVSAKVGPSKQVVTVPNWADADEIRPGERMNGFREAHALGNQFIVLFAGTMGWSQGLDVAIEAVANWPPTRSLFLIVGDGVEKEKLELQAAGLPNVRFLPIQPKEVYPQVLAAADACLVTLRAGSHADRSFQDQHHHGGRTAHFGEHSPAWRRPAPDPGGGSGHHGSCLVIRHALAAAVLSLMRDPAMAAKMGNSGRRYVETYTARSIVVCANSSLASPGSECEEAPPAAFQAGKIQRRQENGLRASRVRRKSSRGLSWRGLD